MLNPTGNVHRIPDTLFGCACIVFWFCCQKKAPPYRLGAVMTCLRMTESILITALQSPLSSLHLQVESKPDTAIKKNPPLYIHFSSTESAWIAGCLFGFVFLICTCAFTCSVTWDSNEPGPITAWHCLAAFFFLFFFLVHPPNGCSGSVIRPQISVGAVSHCLAFPLVLSSHVPLFS